MIYLLIVFLSELAKTTQEHFESMFLACRSL